MTNPLAARLRKLTEYELDNPTNAFGMGVGSEHARLTPLIAALIECVEVIARRHQITFNEYEYSDALARLEKLCSGDE